MGGEIEWDSVEGMVEAYLDAAEWTEAESMEGGIGWNKEAYKVARRACWDFLEMGTTNEDVLCMLRAGGWTPEQAGHDLWLTRNGHGTGFWDRDRKVEKLGELLSNYAERMGEQYVVVGDDGWIYLEGAEC